MLAVNYKKYNIYKAIAQALFNVFRKEPIRTGNTVTVKFFNVQLFGALYEDPHITEYFVSDKDSSELINTTVNFMFDNLEEALEKHEHE